MQSMEGTRCWGGHTQHSGMAWYSWYCWWVMFELEETQKMIGRLSLGLGGDLDGYLCWGVVALCLLGVIQDSPHV